MMKRVNIKIILSCGFIFYSFVPYAQNNTIDSLQKDLQTQKEDTSKVNTLNELSYQIRNVNLNTSIQYAKDALALSEKVNFSKGQGVALLRIGIMREFQNNHEEAIENILAALKIFEKLDHKSKVAECYDALGDVYLGQIEYAEAYKYLLAAFDIRKEIGDKKWIATSYLNIGWFFEDQNNYNESLKNAYLALRIFEEIRDTEKLALTFVLIAVINEAQGNYAEALSHYKKCLKLFEETGVKPSIASAHKAISGLLFSQGNYQEALKKTQEALKIFTEWGATQYIAWAYCGIGDILEREGMNAYSIKDDEVFISKLKEAEKNYRLALKIYEELGSRNDIVTTYRRIGTVYFDLHEFKKAKTYFEKGLQLAGEDVNRRQDLYLRLSYIDSAEGNYRHAYDNYKRHIFYRDSIFNGENTRKLEQIKLQYEFEKKEDQILLLSTENKLKTAIATKEGQRKKFAYAGIGILLLSGAYGFHRYRRRKKLQSQKAIMSERLRISRELHDEVGATLSGIAMYSHLTKEQIKTAQNGEVEKSLNIMQQSAGEMVNKLNDIVWLVNPEQDNLQKLVARLEEYARDMAAIKSMQVKINVPGDLTEHSLPIESRRNIYLFCKEAINNAVKYSEGSLLELTVKEEGNRLEFSVSDNGKGFDAVVIKRGNGLENMQKRADEIGAKLILQSKLNEGALVSMQYNITR